MKTYTFILFAAVVLLGCSDPGSLEKDTSDFEGLWVIQSVKVGDSEMTPNARWTRFHADSTFESGNGKFQHTYGKWKLDAKSTKLSFNTSNGIKDAFEPFTVSILPDKMIWERTEEGQKVVVELRRSDELPETHGDKLIGLWSLITEDEHQTYSEAASTTEKTDYLFFRWDMRYILNTGDTRMTGIYQVHAHRPEVVLIPDDHRLDRTRWEVFFKDTGIRLRELDTDSTHLKHLKRIHQFPH